VIIASIQYKTYDGKYVKDPCAQDKALALIRAAEETSGNWGTGWSWFVAKIGVYCLIKAQCNSTNTDQADLWITRYKAIRSIQ
jgi:hypothetical protein